MFIVLWKAQRLLWHSTILMIHVNTTSFQRGLSDQQTLGDQRLMLSRRAGNLEKIWIKIFLIKFYCTPITNSHLNNYEICCEIDCVIGFIDCENHTMNRPYNIKQTKREPRNPSPSNILTPICSPKTYKATTN